MRLTGHPFQLPYPRCAAPMAHLNLPSHSSATVPVDHYTPCRLVWFDRLESVQLGGQGWIALLRQLQHQGPGTALPPAHSPCRPTSGCADRASMRQGLQAQRLLAQQ